MYGNSPSTSSFVTPDARHSHPASYSYSIYSPSANMEPKKRKPPGQDISKNNPIPTKKPFNRDKTLFPGLLPISSESTSVLNPPTRLHSSNTRSGSSLTGHQTQQGTSRTVNRPGQLSVSGPKFATNKRVANSASRYLTSLSNNPGQLSNSQSNSAPTSFSSLLRRRILPTARDTSSHKDNSGLSRSVRATSRFNSLISSLAQSWKKIRRIRLISEINLPVLIECHHNSVALHAMALVQTRMMD